MTKARDLANLASDATALATDAELAAVDLTPITTEIVMQSK